MGRSPRRKPPLPLDEIKAAARGRWPEILSQLGGCSRDILDGQSHSCPRCGGVDRFRLIDVDAGACLCNQCFSHDNGDGIAAIQWLKGWTFVESAKELQQYLRIENSGAATGTAIAVQGNQGKGARKKKKSPGNPAERLTFRKWNPLQPYKWATEHKPGVKAESLPPAGSVLAKYLKVDEPNRKFDGYDVIAIPTFGPSLLAAPPVGWTVYRLDGGLLPVFHGKGNPTTYEKVKQTKGSVSGLIGRHALEILSSPGPHENVAVVWKVEGPTDLLALYSIIPPELRSTHLVVTNSSGAGERPDDWILELLAGQVVYVIHDCDLPGQRGATQQELPDRRPKLGWCPLLAASSREVRNIVLPYPIAESHGPDLRDWIREGHTYGELLDRAAAANIWPKPEKVANGNSEKLTEAATVEIPSEAAPAKPLEKSGHTAPNQSVPPPAAPINQAPIEADDDPHRLARLYLSKYTIQHDDGLSLRFWRDEWHLWTGTHYRKVPHRELRASVNAAIKREFDRLNLFAQECLPRGRDEVPPATLKVGQAIVTNTLGAMESICVLSANIEQGSWLLDRNPKLQKWVALQNGILKIDELVEPPTNPPAIPLLGDSSSTSAATTPAAAIPSDSIPSDSIPSALHPHSPAWFSPVCLPYSYSPTAHSARWDAFIDRVSSSDEQSKRILQEWAGYLLTPDTSQQQFLMLEGEGSNGKSVYCAAIEALLGPDNVSHVSVENFGNQFALYGTIGKLANIVADIGELDRIAEGFLKSFVSGDRMTFDRKNLSAVECVPTARLMIATNNRPRFSDKSSGIWRRVLVLPFAAEITAEERVVNMDHSWWWYESGEMPGILNWAIEGLRRLRSQGRFTESLLSQIATEEYRRETNTAKAFLVENYEEANLSPLTGAVYEVLCTKLYKDYREYCLENGNSPMNESNFGKEVRREFRRAMKMRKRDGDGRYYVYAGIREIFEASSTEIPDF